MHILPAKKLFVLCSLLNDWNYIWNKYCNLPFLAICPSLLPLLIILASSWYQKAKIGLRMSLQNKKMINYHIKGLYKSTCYKTKSNFSEFFFSHWLLHKCFFSFLIKAFVNFKILIRFHWQAFIIYKNGENLKMLIEIFCQKPTVSNAILTFLYHLKPKIFFVGIERHHLLKSLDPSLQIKINFMIITTSMVYTLFKSEVVSSPPEVFRFAMVSQTPRIRCLENSWCILMFTLLAATFIFSSFS